MFTETQTSECTIPFSELVSLRLYSDTRPHYSHVADLQKGLILVYRGIELVGEGTGFGVPIVRYLDKTYFSSSSTVRIFHKGNCTTAIKQYTLDMVSQNQFRRVKVDHKIMRKLRISLDELYKKHKHWRLLTLANLSQSVGMQKDFVPVKPRGNATVTYRIHPSRISVRANFELLEKNKLQRIFVLNEQSSRFFRKYWDSNDTVLLDKKIGAWEKVEAEWAGIANKSDEVGFRLLKVKDSALYRGREYLQGTFDWVGLDYEFGPEKTNFEYDIEILGRPKTK